MKIFITVIATALFITAQPVNAQTICADGSTVDDNECNTSLDGALVSKKPKVGPDEVFAGSGSDDFSRISSPTPPQESKSDVGLAPMRDLQKYTQQRAYQQQHRFEQQEHRYEKQRMVERQRRKQQRIQRKERQKKQNPQIQVEQNERPPR